MTANLEVLDPVAQLASELGQYLPPAERPSSLEGKRIGLYWNRKPGGNWALQRLRELLEQRLPGVETHFYNARRPIPEDVLEEVRTNCDLVVGVTAD